MIDVTLSFPQMLLADLRILLRLCTFVVIAIVCEVIKFEPILLRPAGAKVSRGVWVSYSEVVRKISEIEIYFPTYIINILFRPQ